MAEILDEAVASDMAIQYCAQFSVLRTALHDFFLFMLEQDALHPDVHRSIKNDDLFDFWCALEGLPTFKEMWKLQTRPSIKSARVVSNILNLVRSAVLSADLLPEEE